MSSSVTSFADRKPATGGAATSRGVFVGMLPVKNCRPVLDADAARRNFPVLWAQFLRENFRSSVEVAVAFGVAERTARTWIEGTNTPRGEIVAAAVVSIPEFRVMLGVAA